MSESGIETTPMTSSMIEYIARTELVPKAYRGQPAAIAAAMLLGRDLGMAPMESLLRIDVIDGKPSPSSEWMVSRILEDGHLVYPTVQTSEICTVVGERWRNGVKVGESSVTFTWEQAARAGLVNKSNWKNYPEAMLFWRAAAQLARQFFPDCLGGVRYLADELGADVMPAPVPVLVDSDEDDVIEVRAIPPPTPAKNPTQGNVKAVTVTRGQLIDRFQQELLVDEWDAVSYMDLAVEHFGFGKTSSFSKEDADAVWEWVVGNVHQIPERVDEFVDVTE